MATYLVVFAMLACPMSFWSLQASIPPLACTVPVVCRKVRMYRKVNMRISSGSRDHLIDSESAELLATFAGEDVAAPGLLLALEPFQALCFVGLQVMNAVYATLETPNLHGALAPVDVVPAQIDQLADPQAVQEGYQRHHVVAVTVAVALEGGEQPVQFVLG